MLCNLNKHLSLDQRLECAAPKRWSKYTTQNVAVGLGMERDKKLNIEKCLVMDKTYF